MTQSTYDLLQNEHLQQSPFSFDDSLYCQEDGDCFSDETGGCDEFNAPRIISDMELCWEEHEQLNSLLLKEEGNKLCCLLRTDPCLANARRYAVIWMLRVHNHYSFSVVTALLAVNYLDRFFSAFEFQKGKPWLTQLVAVACLSLAAKVEETQVPLLLDLQVEDSNYMFEAKTIQKMELLVLSTLEWKMNPVTPHSFLHYTTRILGLKHRLCWEYLRRCEMVLLTTISDVRVLSYLPSVVAVATMLHVINRVEPSIEEEYQTQLLSVLGVDRAKVDECGEVIRELAMGNNIHVQWRKRKAVCMPGSPNGVIDVSFSSDSSNESWAVASQSAKKTRVEEERHLERVDGASSLLSGF